MTPKLSRAATAGADHGRHGDPRRNTWEYDV